MFANWDLSELDPWENYMRNRMREFMGPEWDDWAWNAPPPPSSWWNWPTTTPSIGGGGVRSANAPSSQAPTAFRKQREPAVRVDISETDDLYIVRADLPGVRKEDVRLSVDDEQKILMIDANAQNPHIEPSPAGCGATESSFGSQSPQRQPPAEWPSSQSQQQREKQPQPSSQEQTQVPIGHTAMPGTAQWTRSQMEQRANSPPSSAAASPMTTEGKPRRQQLEIEEPLESQRETFQLTERRTGRLHRTLRLPKNTNTNASCTHFEHGVLTVMFRKNPEPETKRTLNIA